MKKLLIILLFALPVSTSAQLQQGLVKTAGKKGQPGTPLNGVLFKTNTLKTTPVISDKNGNFSFPVSGQSFRVSQIKKNDYILADNDIIGRRYVYTPSAAIVFAMVPLDEYRVMQKDIEERAMLKYKKIFAAKIQKLEEEYEHKKINDAEYIRRTEELEKESNSFRSMIARLSDKYARTDYDYLDSLGMQFNKYIEMGEYDLAEAVISSKGSLSDRKSDIESEEQLSNKLRKSAEIKRQDLIDDYGRLYQLALSRMQPDSAQYWLEQRADFDTTNVAFQLSTVENLINRYSIEPIWDNNKIKHLNTNRKYLTRAMRILSKEGKENSMESIQCLQLLWHTYENDSNGVFSPRLSIADKVVDTERAMGKPSVLGLYMLYQTLFEYKWSTNPEIYNEYYQKCKKERYEELAVEMNKTLDDPIDRYYLFNLYERIAGNYSFENKKKEYKFIKLGIEVGEKLLQDEYRGDGWLDIKYSLSSDYEELGNYDKSWELFKGYIADLKNEMYDNNKQELLPIFISQCEVIIKKSKEKGDYDTMQEYTWDLYSVYRKEIDQFSTFRTRLQSALYLQQHAWACVQNKKWDNVFNYALESMKLAEDACNWQSGYPMFLYNNFLILAQYYAANQDYPLALSTITKAREINPKDEEAIKIEEEIKKQSKK